MFTDDISKDLGKTVEEVHEAERKHYFIDYFSVEKPTWYRMPWVHDDELRFWLTHFILTDDYRQVRIFRESDLSTVVTYEGEEMTLRELFYGSMYQGGHIIHLARYFHEQEECLDA